MGLISDKQIKEEQSAKRLNFALQACTNILAGNWDRWIEGSDGRNRYNTYTSRLETLKNAQKFGLCSLGLMVYLKRGSVSEDRIQRDDYIPFDKILKLPESHLFLRGLFGDPFAVIDNKVMHSFGELYLYMLNCKPTDAEKAAFEEYVKKLGSLDLKDLTYAYLLFDWYVVDPEDEVYKLVENYYANSVMKVSNIEKFSVEDVMDHFDDLKKAFRFWSFLIPKMEGTEGKNFRKEYRKYFVPTKDSGGVCEEPVEDRVRRAAVVNGVSAIVELGQQSVKKLKNPFPGFENVALAQPFKPVEEEIEV